MPVLHFPCQSNADLPDMIGGEGGGDGDALCLTEGIVLHGDHKVDNHLYDLYRGRSPAKSPENSTARISTRISIVSHRMASRCLTVFGTSSDKNAPIIYAEMGIT